VSARRHRVAVVTWAPGGNLPPLLAAGALLRARGHEVKILASEATRTAAARAGLPTLHYSRAAAPDPRVAFERQARALMAAAAGVDIALDVHQRLAEWRPDLAVIDCMLPAAAAAAEAAGTPAASLVHFLYGPARRVMLDRGETWTTDLASLNATRRALSLAPLGGGPAAWEACDLVLVTAPRWLDIDAGFPANVVHAGPLGMRTAASRRPLRPPRVLLTFSTTVMEGQVAAIRNACAAIAGTGCQAVLTLGPAITSETVDLPPEIEVLRWADHDQLLRTCAAVVTHAGLGTTLRALTHGVPLLMLPLGRDQHLNAARVTELGAGIRLPADAAPEQIRAALTSLLDDPAFAESAARLAKRIAHDHPDRRATDALEQAIARPSTTPDRR
jgi:UDP:flavonoid glycosyltransferase YjiC (YdhE family)